MPLPAGFFLLYCLSKTIAYGYGSSRRQLKHAVFSASALSRRNQATRYAGGCWLFGFNTALLAAHPVIPAKAGTRKKSRLDAGSGPA
jgi:hypothetical protein